MVSLLVVYAPTCLSVCQVYIDSLSQELGLSTLDDSGLTVLPACPSCFLAHTQHTHTPPYKFTMFTMFMVHLDCLIHNAALTDA